MYAEYMGEEVARHNKSLEELVIAGCKVQDDPAGEFRLTSLEQSDSPAVTWLVDQVAKMSAEFCGFPSTHGIEVTLRGIALRKFNHISTHDETAESDLGVAYWPSGSTDQIGSKINQRANGVDSPIFKLEDPSRLISGLRLPMESQHSVDACPRPGLMAVYPAHLPHNMHPYRGDKTFVHIVAQVRMPWPKNYSKGRYD